MKQENRCTKCNKLLFKSNDAYESCNLDSAHIEIVCIKCKCVNKYKIK